MRFLTTQTLAIDKTFSFIEVKTNLSEDSSNNPLIFNKGISNTNNKHKKTSLIPVSNIVIPTEGIPGINPHKTNPTGIASTVIGARANVCSFIKKNQSLLQSQEKLRKKLVVRERYSFKA